MVACECRSDKTPFTDFVFASFTQAFSHALSATSSSVLLTNHRERLRFSILRTFFATLFFTMAIKRSTDLHEESAHSEQSTSGMAKCTDNVNSDLRATS